MQNKVVIITGASSGIGKALAVKYINEGWNVVIAARREDRLLELQKKLGPDNVLPVKTDVTKPEDCRILINKAIEKFGQIDVLINNAGISMRALFNNTEMEVMHQLMNVNYWGTVNCTKYALPHLLKQKGSLVGVISVGGYVGLPGRAGYSASKFAVRGFLETLRIENLKTGLHVLIAAPGFTASEIRKSALTANGNKQGETPRNENKMMSAEECAHHIYRAVEKRKRQLILTFLEGKFTVFLSKIMPRFLDKLNYNMFASEPDSPFK
ncbi:Short-chain dehydrogenase [Tangfeifania diversioriginum]|uniref:Short-chain dehydrogenase n=1 Tax=Tangfeifania diversioriginum TaxID=1168035 RepID=A0A1M6EAY9_9BACT|nr:SDR family oxidoreductase [Tangfeifania diversioriginum]SHI82583.1 Short-chain dehydrogenase [Tangfeifania diversioriginum]